ncbi:MAG: hypothetical protein ISR52_01075 [Rhodospirillales bacterium]|nr:hypothetical protein [Rhodospirillales bacterium]
MAPSDGPAEQAGPATATDPQDPVDPVTLTVEANWLFARLEPWILDTLNPEQKEALHRAAFDTGENRPPLNIRVSLPFLRRHFYLTVIGGEERRSRERRNHDRHRYPLRTAANIAFVVGIGAVLYMMVLVVLGLQP